MTDMNLGPANLRYVNASKPQILLNTASEESVAVSEDYHSFPSDESIPDDRTTIARYHTPPSHMQSQSELAGPPTRPQRFEQSGPSSLTASVRFNDDHDDRVPPIPPRSPTRSSPTRWRPTEGQISPPTPGLDDSPYIRFAIDQLTRDEELLGTRRQGAGSEDSYTQRFIRGEDVGRPEIRDQHTYPVSQISNPTVSPIEQLDEGTRRRNQDDSIPQYTRQISAPTTRRPVPPPVNDVFQAAEPTFDPARYPKLTYKPRALRALSLCALILCCLLMIIALIFSNVWSSRHNGLWRYDAVGTSRFFLFEFLPQILASIIILWLLVIQNSAHRIFPFSALASGPSSQRSRALRSAALFPTNYMIPNFQCFKNGEPLLGVSYLFFWTALFTVPLQSSAFQTRLFRVDNQEVWMWTAVQPVVWTLVVLYALLVMALLLLLLSFARRGTGLKWDVTSLADILVLIHGSNSFTEFDGCETKVSTRGGFLEKDYKLGYWCSSKRPKDVFHGIGEENAPIFRSSIDTNKADTDSPRRYLADSASMDLEAQRPREDTVLDSLREDIHSFTVRYRWVPWFLRDTFVVAWIVIAIILLIAFLVVSFVKNAVKMGFLPLLPAPTTSKGFSPADFLYSFIPSLIGMILFLLWQPIDMYFRALQPFASLGKTRGSTADHSLLLNYTACLPIEVTVRAALNGHLKVAWISFISLLSITLPILAGGIFTAQFFVARQEVRIAACMPAYYALTVFLIIYALSFFIIWPLRKRRLPHDIRTLADLISFFYQSPLLDDPAFREPLSKIDLVTRLLGTPLGEKATPRYAYGVYVGRDRREHLGIDRWQRPGSGISEMMVTTRTMF